MFTIMKDTLRRSRAAILGWGLGLGLFGAYVVSLYDQFSDMQSQFLELVSSYPEELLVLIGNVDELFTPKGFLNTYVFSYLPIFLGIYLVMAGANLLSGEEEAGILDLLISHPVRRTSVILGRWAGLMASIALMILIMWICMAVSFSASTLDVGPGVLFMPFLSLFAISVLFATLALLISMVLPSRHLAAAISGAVLLGGFVIDLMVQINPGLETINRLQPMAYFQGANALEGLNWAWILGLAASTILLAATSGILFYRRDIRVAGERGWGFTEFFGRFRRIAKT